MFLKTKYPVESDVKTIRSYYTGLLSTLIFIFGVVFVYVNAQAQHNGAALNSQAITSIISNKSIIGKKPGKIWKHYYLPNGHIHYSDNSGQTANGYWRVEKDLYCDNWPPSTQWQCYILYLKGDKLVFKSTYGNHSFQAALSQ